MPKSATTSKIKPFDRRYHDSLASTLTEWNSLADHEAYDQLQTITDEETTEIVLTNPQT